jgi:lipopolysaccharide biosynthesis glycosyltransferase
MCVFYNRKYIELLNLLLKSLKTFGNVADSVDILILTHKTFEGEVKSITSTLQITSQIVVMDLNSIPESKWARFKIFDINIDLCRYSKILYLDIDIIIQKDIHKVFNMKLDNKLYARRQGDISGEYYGGNLFKEKGIFEKTPAFCSGVLLFKPCEEVQQLFSRTIEHIQDFEKSGKQFGACIDQPFLNFHAIISNLHEIDLLSDIVTNNPDVNTTNEVVCHFAGNSCSYEVKVRRMTSYYNYLLTLSSDFFPAYK